MKNYICNECGTLVESGMICDCTRRPARSSAPCGTVHRSDEQRDELNRIEIAHTEMAQQWLADHGVVLPHMSAIQRRESTKRYRDMLARTARTSDAHPRAWAHSLKSDYIDGKYLLPCQIALASEAMDEIWEGGSCRSK